ncbi:MAG: hypothetical protein HAW63_00540 [Bdellovibrionaceae bacterium]|nr:hypothetical protein [Pseudobdellovibrionaceae bacterium]
MSFSKWVFIFIISTSLSCSKKLSPVNSSVEKIKNLKSIQDICWTNLPKTMKKYFSSSSMDLKEVNRFWQCINNSLKLFTSSLKGEKKKQYSYADIEGVLHKVLKDTHSAKKILSIITLLKDLSFFRDTRFLNKIDINFLTSTINTFKIISINLHPHRKILFFSNAGSVSYDKYLKATKALKNAFNTIEKIFVSYKSSYNFESLDNFLKLFSKKHKEISEFAFSVKSFIFKDNKKQIANKQWGGLISPLASLYSAYRGFQLFYLNNNTPSFNNLDAQFKYYGFVENMFAKSLIHKAGFRNRKKGYAVKDIKKLILQYQKIKPNNLAITSDFLDASWLSINKLLNNNLYKKEGVELNSQFFSIQHMLSLKAFLLNWLYVQNLNLQFLGISKQSLFSSDTLLIKHKKQIVSQVNLVSIRHSFSQRINTYIGKQKMDNHGRLLFTNSFNSLFTWNNLTHLNQESLLINSLFFLYAGKDKKINLKELNLAFNELKPIFVSAKILNAKNKKIPSTIYRETNLFMPSSQPDAMIDRQEATEYLHYIFSGLNIKTMWARGVSKNCPSKKQGLNTFYKTSCVYNQFLANQKFYFSFLPKQIYQSGFLNNSKEWFNAATIAAGHVDGKIFNKKNLFKTGMLLQYVATIFQKFDSDANLQISYFESLNFFPLVKEALQSVLPVEDTLELQHLYTYVLKEGALPNPSSDVLSEFRLLSWSLNPNKAYQASFLQILKVFKALRSITAN